MAKKKATEKLEKQDSASKPGEQNLNEDKALEKPNAKLLQDSINALQALDEDKVDPDLVELGYSQICHEAAEDADDEFDTDDDNDDDDDDDDYEEVWPLIIKKAKTGTDSDQVHLSTNHPKQNTQITAHTHGPVKWQNNVAQAETLSAEVDPTAFLALKQNLSRGRTPYLKPFSVNRGSDLLHPSPPLRRRKGSNASRENTSDSATSDTMMSNAQRDQDSAAENSATYQTPTRRGKMPEGRSNQISSSSEEHENRAEISQSDQKSTSSDYQAPQPDLKGSSKAGTVLGYVEKDETNPKKSMTDLVSSPKASHEKKSFRKFFHRKASKEPITPSSSSGKIAGRPIISAPTLIDASPNAKALLNSASSLIPESPGAKHVVNYSRPIVHSSSDVSSGSPSMRGGSGTALHGSNLLAGPGTVLEGPADKSGTITVGLNTSLIHDHSEPSIVHENKTADKRRPTTETVATEKDAEASDSDSFNPSDYSGDENSVQQAVAVPIVFSGKAKLVDIPPRRTRTAAPSNRSGIGSAIASGTTYLTDHEAEILGAQDADRYLRNAMTSQTRSANVTTEDPFIDPPFQNLLAKPANEIAAKEMARIKAEREAGKMNDVLIERMNALRVKSDAKLEVEHPSDTTNALRTNNAGGLLSKIRTYKKNPRMDQEQQESGEKIGRKVEADIERGLREEHEINAIIKAKLAAKDAANEGIRGAGIQRVDYGPPNLRTALGGNATQNGDNTTARGRFEGY